MGRERRERDGDRGRERGMEGEIVTERRMMNTKTVRERTGEARETVGEREGDR